MRSKSCNLKQRRNNKKKLVFVQRSIRKKNVKEKKNRSQIKRNGLSLTKQKRPCRLSYLELGVHLDKLLHVRYALHLLLALQLLLVLVHQALDGLPDLSEIGEQVLTGTQRYHQMRRCQRCRVFFL